MHQSEEQLRAKIQTKLTAQSKQGCWYGVIASLGVIIDDMAEAIDTLQKKVTKLEKHNDDN